MVAEDPESLPLRRAWPFLVAHGLDGEATEIRTSLDRLGSYTSTLKRAKVINLLTKHDLLSEFVAQEWPNGATDSGRRLIQRYQRIYERFASGSPEDDDAEEEDLDETRFAYEADLRDYLANNLHLVEDGMTLWPSEGEGSAVEYPIDQRGRRIDILAKDLTGTPVVIELKVSRGHERTIGQALYYRGRVKELFGTDRVRIIIVARDIGQELRTATVGLPDVGLFEYRLSMSLVPVK